jgi:hypothetical protein
MKRSRTPDRPDPFGPVLLALAMVTVFSTIYFGFGIGKDALTYALALLLVVGLPVVAIFGITGIVLGVRRLLRGRKRQNELPQREPERPV